MDKRLIIYLCVCVCVYTHVSGCLLPSGGPDNILLVSSMWWRPGIPIFTLSSFSFCTRHLEGTKQFLVHNPATTNITHYTIKTGISVLEEHTRLYIIIMLFFTQFCGFRMST